MKKSNWVSALSESDPRLGMPHKERCAKCRYGANYGGGVLCNYYCTHWDETGIPERRPCDAEKCTVFDPGPKKRKKTSAIVCRRKND